MASTQPKKRIGIMAPGRVLPQAVQAQVMDVAQRGGFLERLDLVFHDQCALEHGHFAGPDAARAQAFLDFANDPSMDAIWFARGGYGSNRILDLVIPNLAESANTKIWFGYSDAGYLLGALHGLGIGRSVHGPMPADILREGGETAIRRALAWLASPHVDAGPPRAAFNLTTLSHLASTAWMPDLRSHELWIEEVGEHFYAIDRALFSVLTSANVGGISGMRLGRCSDIPENDIDFKLSEVEIASHWCTRIGAAYLGRCDIGHDSANAVVPFRR